MLVKKVAHPCVEYDKAEVRQLLCYGTTGSDKLAPQAGRRIENKLKSGAAPKLIHRQGVGTSFT